MEIIKISSGAKLNKEELSQVTKVLNKGGVIVVPTDTSYGLAARIDNQKGLEKIFILKGREKKKSISMAVRSRAQALKYCVISCKPIALWKEFLPGPLTLVVWSKKKTLPYLQREDGTIAIRQVPTAMIDQILRALPVPITITSANKSGKGDIYSLKEFKAQYKKAPFPDIFIDAGRLKKRSPSTVVSVKKSEPVYVIRKGPITEKQIMKIINKKH